MRLYGEDQARPDELTLARIAREQEEDAQRLAKTRDIAAWQATMARLRPLIPPDRLFIATGAQYADECRRQLPDLPAGHVIVEIKAVEALTPLMTAQVLSYLKATGVRVGLLINFNVPVLKQGIRRLVLTSASSP